MRGDRASRRAEPEDDGAAAPVEADADAALDQRQPAETLQPQPGPKSWRNLWQMPTILVSVTLIVVGVRSAMRPAAANDFDGALSQVEKLLASREVEPAFQQMRGMIEPHLHQASAMQQARFHALSGDLTFIAQERSGELSVTNNRHIIQQYDAAREMGLALDVMRLERWAEALLHLQDFGAARDKLGELRAMASRSDPVAQPDPQAAQPGSDDQPERLAAAAAAQRLFRRLIEAQLAAAELDAPMLMETLAEYRLTQQLSPADEAWVAARLAELRLETGRADAAVDGLLIEIRRIESLAATESPRVFGELYMLLGRGYLELGQAEAARTHLDRALGMFHESDAQRGEALVLLGEIDLARGEHDAAFERFNIVAEDFIGTRAHMPGVMGRAEAASVLGDHAAAQVDFRELAGLLRKSPPRRDVPATLVAQRLCDRHDAALALGRLERALDYVRIAELLFDPEAVPQEVLFRLASTNRQVAENLLAAAGERAAVEPDDIDPAVRYEAHRRFEQAGNDYLRHVAAESVRPLSDEDWGASLWAAAECFDRAGLHHRAIAEFEKYLGSRAPDDARRAEAMFRIAQAHHARLEYDKAAGWYQQVLEDRSRSSFAARCHVPLARCLLEMGRLAEAKQALQQVLAGQRLLDPAARDYRDALIELGRLHHDQGEHVQAIERLAEARQRYPDDPRMPEIEFLLADAYRASALAIGQRLSQDLALAPLESGALAALRGEHLQQAIDLFGGICERFGPSVGRSVAPSVQDLVRRAHLYQADCAFELAEYQDAVELYELASRQYSAGASSMYALVQIVNCYSALGDGERASAAHQRALLRLRQLPDSAFDAPDALMDRAAWERWLRNSPAGHALAVASPESG